MNVKYKDGDLVEDINNFDIVVHGCNCFCTMGAGIARQLSNKYPQVALVDKMTKTGDKNKLGRYTSTLVTNTLVVNLYTQYSFGNKKRHFNYAAFLVGLRSLFQLFPQAKFGLPKIGAGLAEGDWNKIEQIIEDLSENIDVTVYNYKV